MAVRKYISIFTLNVNGLNSPIKRQSGWINTKSRPKYMLLTRDSLHIWRHTQSECEHTKKKVQGNGNQKKPMVTGLSEVEVAQLYPTLCNPIDCAWSSPGQNTGVGSLSLLQGIFPTQELNWGLLHCRQILYQLSYQGRPSMFYIR